MSIETVASSATDEVLNVSTMRSLLRATLLVVLSISLPSAARAAADWGVGDKVEVFNSSWFPATILEIGSGSHAGQFKVHYDGYSSSSNQWITGKNVRAIRVVASTTGIRPRAGRYLVLSYGGGNPLHLGYFDLLSGDRYQFFNNGGEAIGAGTYAFDAKTSTLQWRGGPFEKSGWGGGFTVEREGKTHTIRLTRSTIGTNSTDS